MRDPHIDKLHYTLHSGDHVRFESPDPIGEETDHFQWRLADGRLTIEMKEHHPTARSARARVDPWLKAWEIDRNLEWSGRAISFQFAGAEVSDRNRLPPGEPNVVTPEEPVFMCGTGHVKAVGGHSIYPPPNGSRLPGK